MYLFTELADCQKGDIEKSFMRSEFTAGHCQHDTKL